VSAFADAEIIRMANEQYIPVTGDDWYQRRRQDQEGEFFRKVADAAGRTGPNGGTRQGIYCFTADGEILAYKNAGQNADVMRDVLKQGLAKWNRLPVEKRKPGAVTVDAPGRVDGRYTRTPPEGGLIATVYARILDTDDKGFCKGMCDTLGGDRAARDHLWLTAADVKSLVPNNPKVGDTFPMPLAIAMRIVRFHLVDNTRGEPPAWTREEVRSQSLMLKVASVSAERIKLTLEGSALLATVADPAEAKRGFDAKLFGYLSFDRTKEEFDRFDIVAEGNFWGEGTYTRGARPGRKPFGVAIELAGDKPTDRIPPQFAREFREYFGK
jgi:hypothetical protein